MKQLAHETYLDEDNQGFASSDRAFGFVMAAALGLVSVLSAWRGGWLWPWTLAVTVPLILAAWLVPSSLNRLKRLWLRLGLLLHKIVNPIVMGLLFYGSVLPTALVVRMRGSDLLRLKRDSSLRSYWIPRTPPGPAPETMKDQF